MALEGLTEEGVVNRLSTKIGLHWSKIEPTELVKHLGPLHSGELAPRCRWEVWGGMTSLGPVAAVKLIVLPWAFWGNTLLFLPFICLAGASCWRPTGGLRAREPGDEGCPWGGVGGAEKKANRNGGDKERGQPSLQALPWGQGVWPGRGGPNLRRGS